MPLFTRTALTAIILAASLSAGQAQTTQDPHHPQSGPSTEQTQATTGTPKPPGSPAAPSGPAGGMPMPGMMGGGFPGGAPAMMGDMHPMMEMMSRMMGGMGERGTSAESDASRMGRMMRSMGEMMRTMGRMMEEGGMVGMAEAAPAPTARRIAYLKSELGITDAQEPQWTAFVNAVLSGAQTARAVYAEALQKGLPTSAPDRAELRVKLLSTVLEALKATVSAEKSLYAVLSDDQRQIADKLLSGPMGRM